MSENGQPEAPKMPIFPWELILRNSATFFEPTPDGGMVVGLAPAALGPAGQIQMMPPMIRIVFGEAGWTAFQAKVAADGGRSPITIARMLPPEPPKP